MANAISENNSRELWKEVRKIRNKNSTYSTIIDNKMGDDEINTMSYIILYALNKSRCLVF